MRTGLATEAAQHRYPSACLAKLNPETMPKRLLEVSIEGDVVRLLDVTKAHKYAVLSYCWGGDQKTKTITSNLMQHKHGINVQTLPQTIQDAIDVTRRLRLEYLWVDALCMALYHRT
jgi:hypothetical protein